MERDDFLEEEVLHRGNDCSLTKRRLGSFVKGSQLGLVKMCVVAAKRSGLAGAAGRIGALWERRLDKPR